MRKFHVDIYTIHAEYDSELKNAIENKLNDMSHNLKGFEVHHFDYYSNSDGKTYRAKLVYSTKEEDFV